MTEPPYASAPSAAATAGSTRGQRWVRISRCARGPRRLPGLLRRQVDGGGHGCRGGTWPPTARGRHRARTRRRSSRGRCRRCRSGAGRRRALRPRRWAAGDRCARTAGRCRRSSASPSPTARQSNAFPQSLTSESRNFSSPFGREHRQVLAAEAVAQQHVEAVDVDAVVGVAVREHDRGEVFDRQVLLEVPEGAVAAVDPHRRGVGAQEVAAARAAAGRAVRARAPENGQLHLLTPSTPSFTIRCPSSTVSTSGPRNLDPKDLKVSTRPLVRKM